MAAVVVVRYNNYSKSQEKFTRSMDIYLLDSKAWAVLLLRNGREKPRLGCTLT